MTTPEERAQSARIAVAIREAVEAEREACAALCDGTAGGPKMCASAIRKRGEVMKPKIYLFCESAAASNVIGHAIAEDGTELAGHLSSNREFSQQDMTSERKRDKYKAHYPDGFDLVWVDGNDAGLAAALERKKERAV